MAKSSPWDNRSGVFPLVPHIFPSRTRKARKRACKGKIYGTKRKKLQGWSKSDNIVYQKKMGKKDTLLKTPLVSPGNVVNLSGDISGRCLWPSTRSAGVANSTQMKHERIGNAATCRAQSSENNTSMNKWPLPLRWMSKGTVLNLCQMEV